MTHRLVVVEWADAIFVLDADEPPEPPIARTVGFLVYDCPEYVTVVSERFDEHPEFSGSRSRAYTTIPRGCIRAIHQVTARED